MAETFNLTIQEVELVSLFRRFSGLSRAEILQSFHDSLRPSGSCESDSHFRFRESVPSLLAMFGEAV